MEIFKLDCFLTEEERLRKEQNRRINKAIKQSKRKQKTIFKLLLLGTGQSGKSTFLRQMRIIYDNGFSDKDKLQYVKVIQELILVSMQNMVDAMMTLKIPYENEWNTENAEVVRGLDVDEVTSITDYLSALKQLWLDSGIQECYKRRREYQLDDCIKYYMNHIDRIASDNYLPSEGDILNVRIPTTGLIEYCFNVDNFEFQMIDVGGQRTERQKWFHCFDNVKAILFLVALSEYDQVLLESDDSNRLKESLSIFRKISQSEWFSQTSLVVFFNKTDLLLEKIMYSDLVDYFPKFKGPRHDNLSAQTFIANMFVEVASTRQMYRHFTCATDTENIKIVFAIVHDTILSAYLRETML